MKTLIQNGNLVIDQEIINADLLIEDNTISAIGEHLLSKGISVDKVVDASNTLITPGLVDVHVHFREPGFTYKETIKTGSYAAAHGGVTTVLTMPNLDPTPDTPEKLAAQIKLNQKESLVHCYQYATITEQLKSEKLVDFPRLKQVGAIGFTNDGVGVQKAGTMYQAMRAAAKLDLPLVAHTEDNSLLFKGVMAAGKKADELGLPGILGVTESAQIARDLLLAQATDAHYHVCHVSTKESVAVIRWAKSQGIKVTAEVTPHHLLLTDEDIPEDNGMYKMNPPLRHPADREALIAGLLDGTIDVIATDHAPHSQAEKQQTMKIAPFGIVGIEQAFCLLYTAFVKTNQWTVNQLISWLSTKPAKLFKLPAGELKVGAPADIAQFDLALSEQIAAKDFKSMGINTPFMGQTVCGVTLATWVSGKLVYTREM